MLTFDGSPMLRELRIVAMIVKAYKVYGTIEQQRS